MPQFKCDLPGEGELKWHQIREQVEPAHEPDRVRLREATRATANLRQAAASGNRPSRLFRPTCVGADSRVQLRLNAMVRGQRDLE